MTDAEIVKVVNKLVGGIEPTRKRIYNSELFEME